MGGSEIPTVTELIVRALVSALAIFVVLGWLYVLWTWDKKQ